MIGRKRNNTAASAPASTSLAAPTTAAGDEAVRDATTGVVISGRPVPAWPTISFEDRMATAQFKIHERAHITVDGDSCRGCTTQQCVIACPANLFVPTSDGGILFNYEQCFECGTCYLVCNTEGAITWTYPEGGHGIIFKRT